MSLLLGPNITFIRIGSVLAKKGWIQQLLGWEVPLLIALDTGALSQIGQIGRCQTGRLQFGRDFNLAETSIWQRLTFGRGQNGRKKSMNSRSFALTPLQITVVTFSMHQIFAPKFVKLVEQLLCMKDPSGYWYLQTPLFTRCTYEESQEN